MSDLLDLLVVKDEEVLTGTYYSRRPQTPLDNGIKFAYDIIDEPRSAYNNILNTLNTVQSFQTIKTNDLCGFEIKGYCVTQEGGLWQIMEIVKRLVTPNSKQALRTIRKSIETVYELRMIEVDNPWGLK